MELKKMYTAYDSKPTQISGDVSTTDQTIPVIDVSVFPPAPNFATIQRGTDAEVVLYAGINESTNTLTGCARGVSDTMAGTWGAGDFCFHSIAAENINSIIGNINAIGSSIGNIGQQGTLNVYVSNDGVDSPDSGSKESPYKSLLYALEQAKQIQGHFRYIVNLVKGTYELNGASISFLTNSTIIKSETNNPEDVIINLSNDSTFYLRDCGYTSFQSITINGNPRTENGIIRFENTPGFLSGCIFNGSRDNEKYGVLGNNNFLHITATSFNNCQTAIYCIRGVARCYAVRGSNNVFGYSSWLADIIYYDNTMQADTLERRIANGLINGK